VHGRSSNLGGPPIAAHEPPAIYIVILQGYSALFIGILQGQIAQVAMLPPSLIATVDIPGGQHLISGRAAWFD